VICIEEEELRKNRVSEIKSMIEDTIDNMGHVSILLACHKRVVTCVLPEIPVDKDGMSEQLVAIVREHVDAFDSAAAAISRLSETLETMPEKVIPAVVPTACGHVPCIERNKCI